jgi:TM2 domain-containing membrane protein YozV
MESQRVDMFLAANAKFFPAEKMPVIKMMLDKLDDSKFILLQTIQYKDPTTILLVSLFGGGLGIDRFMLGQTGLGVAKLLTAGGCGVWALIDWFLVMNVARELNFEKFSQIAA